MEHLQGSKQKGNHHQPISCQANLTDIMVTGWFSPSLPSHDNLVRFSHKSQRLTASWVPFPHTNLALVVPFEWLWSNLQDVQVYSCKKFASPNPRRSHCAA